MYRLLYHIGPLLSYQWNTFLPSLSSVPASYLSELMGLLSIWSAYRIVFLQLQKIFVALKAVILDDLISAL